MKKKATPETQVLIERLERFADEHMARVRPQMLALFLNPPTVVIAGREMIDGRPEMELSARVCSLASEAVVKSLTVEQSIALLNCDPLAHPHKISRSEQLDAIRSGDRGRILVEVKDAVTLLALRGCDLRAA